MRNGPGRPTPKWSAVTWNLNMTNETVAAEGPSVAGGADFGFPGDNPMSDPDGDGIWTLTLEVANPDTPDTTPSPTAPVATGHARRTSPVRTARIPPTTMTAQLENITEDTVINTCFGQCSTDGSCDGIQRCRRDLPGGHEQREHRRRCLHVRRLQRMERRRQSLWTTPTGTASTP